MFAQDAGGVDLKQLRIRESDPLGDTVDVLGIGFDSMHAAEGEMSGKVEM